MIVIDIKNIKTGCGLMCNIMFTIIDIGLIGVQRW